MVQGRVLITLVSPEDVSEGFTFLHKGSSPKCTGCSYLHVCVENLERGRVYRVVGQREKRLRCELAETDMRVVEVVEAEIDTVTPLKQAIEGATILFHTPGCRREDCENLELCHPKGLLNGDRCEIVKITGNVQCPEGSPFARVLLRRVPPS